MKEFLIFCFEYPIKFLVLIILVGLALAPFIGGSFVNWIFLALVLFLLRWRKLRKKKHIQFVFLQLLKENSHYIQRFYEIAEEECYKPDKYGDFELNEKKFAREIVLLRQKLGLFEHTKHGATLMELLDQYLRQGFAAYLSTHTGRQMIEEITDGYDFERYLADFFAQQGYTVRMTKSTGDQGADLILSHSLQKIAVQAKYYSQPVGNKAVQEVIAAVQYYGADEGWVVTNATFTPSARALAQKANVQLITGAQLKKWNRPVSAQKNE